MKTLLKKILEFSRKIKRSFDLFFIHSRYRIYRWRGYKIGRNVSIGPGVKLSRQAQLGDFVTLIGSSHFQGDIKIGNHVIISRGCTILATNHDYDLCDALPYGTAYIKKGVIIEDNVWIGANVQIVPGVRIGEGAVIGMGAVVVKDIPPLTIAAGNPARELKSRNQDRYARLVAEHKYLNLIRGNLPHRSANLRRNRQIFQHLMTSRGFVLNIELGSSTPEWKSAILYELAKAHAGILFGNAERYHIAIEHNRLLDIPATAKQVAGVIEQLRPNEPVDVDTLTNDLSEPGSSGLSFTA